MDLSGLASLIKSIAVFFSVILLGYAGVVLITNADPVTRNEWKEIMMGVFLGLSILFLAPVISSAFIGGGYCSP